MDTTLNGFRRAVVLFDIDGTLIRRAGPHHRQALTEAVRLVTGLETTTEGIPVQGMLDGDILAKMMLAAGATQGAIGEAMPRVMTTAEDIYVATCPPLADRVCPGARDLLTALQAHEIPAGLVTGNLRRIAWTKMDRTGLRQYLSFGAFAQMGHTRAELAANAISQAKEKGWIGPGTKLSLIGDHPNDVLAAKANHIHPIAVCTGVVGRDELLAASPDQVVEDMTAEGLFDSLL